MDKQTQNLKKKPGKIIFIITGKNQNTSFGLIGHSNYNSCFDVWQ